MPSYVLNPLLDEVLFEDMLCKKFLGLDLREPPKSLLSVMPIGYKKAEPSCPHILSGTGLAVDSRDCAALTSGHWGQTIEQPCPPPSRWNKMSFWAEGSLSLVEGGSGGLRWPVVGENDPSSHCGQPAELSPTVSSQSSSSSASSSSSSSSSSSRYKTELCRTFAESGACKYGGKCQFAHGAEELRDLSRHPKYKTEPCRTFHTIGYCPYGIRCHFVHNNEDDLGPARAPAPPPPRGSRRPPLLRQSVSFAGFPTAPARLPDPSPLHPFLRTPSASPPASASEPPPRPDPLAAAFAPAPEPRPRFPASLCHAAKPRPLGDGCLRPQQQGMLGSLAPGSRSLSYTSLSDHEGGSGSSASSLSGSETSVFEGAGRRLPIFSQLSVPDDSASSFFI